MKRKLLYPVGSTEALRTAVSILHKEGVPLIDHPAPEITHLLLDVPSFAPDGSLRGGGDVERVLERLPTEVIVVGGSLNHPALQNHRTVDFLQDQSYLADNAVITAHCALSVAAPLLKTTLTDTSVLVIGWGRIGKCLAKLLNGIGADVTVAARKETDRAMLRALGYQAVDLSGPLSPYGLIFSTVPAPIFTGKSTNGIQIDLASKRGLSGKDVIWARGLPGIHAPESSGRCIAETFLRLCKE